MKLLVARREGLEGYTPGRLYVDTVFQCYTLEDQVREIPGKPVAQWKVSGKTAIPRGTYRVIVSQSARFKRRLPEVLNVPGFAGIRIHAGNTDADTEGCILVGDEDPSDGFMGQSRHAFDLLFMRIEEAINCGTEVWITLH